MSGALLDVDRIIALKTVREATSRAHFLSAIRDLGKDSGEFTLGRLEELMRVEEHFQALLLYDQIDFLRQPASASEVDRDFALNVQRICLEAANGFQRFLRNRNAWATTREALDTMFRVTGLALNSIHSFVKWGYFLNEPGRATPWKQVHALYALAEADGYAQVPFVLHAPQPSYKPSVQSLYLRTLILDLLNTGNLTNIQIEVADGWFSSWCNDYSLDTEYSTRNHLFFVDLASDSGMHLMRKDSHGDSIRYIRTDGLKAQIEEVQLGLRHGRLYAGYGAGAVFPVEEHVALLAIIEKLYHSILAGSENRIEERTHFEDREVDVVIGIECVMRKMREAPSKATSASPPAVPSDSVAETFEISPTGMSLVANEAPAAPAFEEPADPDIERWRVHDLSSKGYGLLVDRAASELVLLNGIIALRNHETGGWIVGFVVRKLANRARGEILIGVEVLAYRPLPADLVPASSGSTVRALYLPGLDTNGKLDSVIVGIGDFRTDQTFAIEAGGSKYRVRLNRVIRKGADWLKARFEIESKA
jgi:cyclic-di-GMP-binding protein